MIILVREILGILLTSQSLMKAAIHLKDHALTIFTHHLQALAPSSMGAELSFSVLLHLIGGMFAFFHGILRQENSFCSSFISSFVQTRTKVSYFYCIFFFFVNYYFGPHPRNPSLRMNHQHQNRSLRYSESQFPLRKWWRARKRKPRSQRKRKTQNQQ